MTQGLDSSFFRSAIEASTDGFAALDQQGRLLFLNRAGLGALRIDDFTKYAGRPWPSLWPRPCRAAARRAIAKAGRGRTARFEAEGPAAHGTPTWWDVVVAPVRDGRGKLTGLTATCSDITAVRREATERERTAVRAASAMSGFLATMSHELRTPLNGVLGMAQAMDRGDLSNVQRLRLGVIQSSADALLSLFNDLIDFSDLEGHKVELEHGVVDVGAIAHDAVSIFEALLEDTDVALHVTVAAAASGAWQGDPKRVRQVLHILLSNAVKFTKRGSIAVDVTYDDARLRLRVRDTGVGIAADKISSVFDRFVQGDASPTRGYGGSGLGLAICHDLVKLMGGEVDVESAKGRGSTFTISLPLERAELELVAARVAPAAPGAIRVLAAEDNDANRRVLAALLGAIGIELVIVENGREALEAWRRGGWDLVLMDIQMPVMDGVEATKLMREAERREGRARTPIIAVTANAAPQHEMEYLAAGMDAMVAKPIDLSRLIQVMDSAMSLQEAA